MVSDLAVSLDFLAAIITFLYLTKLLFSKEAANTEKILRSCLEKRSLLNQHVTPRV